MISLHQHRDWLGTAGLFLCMFAVLWIVAWLMNQQGRIDGSTAREPAQRSIPEDPVQSVADIVIEGFRFVHTLPTPVAWPLWELTSKQAVVYEARGEVVLIEIEASFTPERGDPLATLTGEKGRIDLNRMDFEITGGVEPVTVWLRQEYMLQTNSLHWDDEAQIMETDDPVDIQGEGIHIVGTGLRWSIESRTITILHDVQTMAGAGI